MMADPPRYCAGRFCLGRHSSRTRTCPIVARRSCSAGRNRCRQPAGRGKPTGLSATVRTTAKTRTSWTCSKRARWKATIPFFVEAELRDDAAFERAVAAFRALCPLAAERGVVLAYEGTLPAARVRALAERVGSPAFGCYFDLANLVVRGLDPPTEIRQLGDLICRVHVKDLRARKNDCHPGLGRVDFPECAAALAEIGYDGWLMVEQDSTWLTPSESAHASRNYLRGLGI